MKHRNLILSAVTGLALFAASSAQAAILTMGINVLYSATGQNASPDQAVPGNGVINTPVTAFAPGVYNIFQGQVVRIQITATLTNPNVTDGNHTPDGDTFGAAGTPLGIQSISGNLVSTGTAFVLTPSTGTVATRWGTGSGAVDATLQMIPTAIGASFTNLIDQGGDVDLDPSGYGYAQTSLTWDGSVGAPLQGIQNGIPTQVNIVRGGYLANLAGTNTLGTSGINGLAFLDPAAADNSLGTEAFASIVNALVTINVIPVPEPATAGLFGLASLGLLAIRRRHA